MKQQQQDGAIGEVIHHKEFEKNNLYKGLNSMYNRLVRKIEERPEGEVVGKFDWRIK